MTAPLRPGWYDAPPEKRTRPRDLVSPAEKQARRAKGGRRGARANYTKAKLEKVFSEMDEELEP